MSPSWSRLSKTEAKPVKVPESSSAPSTCSGPIYVAWIALSDNGIGGLDNEHWPQPAGGVVRIVRGELARCSSDLAAGWRRSVTDCTGWPVGIRKTMHTRLISRPCACRRSTNTTPPV
jgi:hypothetical protein